MKHRKQICIGLLAHVDAGKTTLSEALLYSSGSIRKLGRVDNRDAFLDTYELERARGITIFSKQAVVTTDLLQITLLDTPGHVDFSAEMERTLQVLDYAVLVISRADGVQGHTRTLWRLLKHYGIPVFLFINKMDQPGAGREELLRQLQKELEAGCTDFSQQNTPAFYEAAAMCEEALLDTYLETGVVAQQEIVRLIQERKLFPCFFGSALKLTGIEELLQGLAAYTQEPVYPKEFGARIYKITRDGQGSRLTHMKITGGSLRVKEVLPGLEEKVNQIRIYSGEKYEAVESVQAGRVCAVTGPSRSRAGEGLGAEKSTAALLAPVLTYRLELPEGTDAAAALPKLHELEEEEPQLHIVWKEEVQEIQVQLMGEVQTEVLKKMIAGRFGIEAQLTEGSIVYKETIAEPVEGVGHFEPLRHYAEVHLLLEPGEAGSGLQFAADCGEDLLARNWQRLVLSQLEEKEHRGVLVGAAVTDMKITLVSGRAHQKHTEGGDFRQAAWRAVRQGLMKAKNVLLEPWYEFRLELPVSMTGRAMSDLDRMSGRFQPPVLEGETAVLCGLAPASELRGYQQEVTAYTRGCGRLLCTLKGYEPCHNAEEIIAKSGYDAERDMQNPADSVFCSHGAGIVVAWDQVEERMHLEGLELPQETGQEETWDACREMLQSAAVSRAGQERRMRTFGGRAETALGTEEVERLLERAGSANRKENRDKDKKEGWRRHREKTEPSVRSYGEKTHKEDCLLVDGYNIIFAWEDLKELAEVSIDGARGRLLDLLCNYQAVAGCNLIVVFDAYRVQGHTTESLDYHNIHVVYTREAETADCYIERFAQDNRTKYRITVATSDGLEQIIIRGQGCALLSARELREEMERAARIAWEDYGKQQPSGRSYLLDELPKELAGKLDAIRHAQHFPHDVRAACSGTDACSGTAAAGGMSGQLERNKSGKERWED